MITKDDMYSFKDVRPGSKVRYVLLVFKVNGSSRYRVYEGNDISEESVFSINGVETNPERWIELFTTYERI
jgi:hypothetical protein